jgi:hypothetical protein
MVDHAVVEELYEVFSAYALPAEVSYCTYCDDAAYERALHGDLRSLAAEIVDKYIWDALHHTGDEEVFKYFLPRVYELLAAGGLPFADPEMVLGRLTMAGWSAWPESERGAVLRLLDAMWDDAMRLSEPPVDIESLLCGLASAFQGAPPQLREWCQDSRPMARQRLAEFVLANANALSSGGLGDPWWIYPEAVAEVVAWLTSPETMACLESEWAAGVHIAEAAEVLRLAAASARRAT